MALEMNDLMALKSLENGMSPYEQFKVGHMQAKKPSGAAVAGLVLGSVGTAAAIGAWIFGPTFASARAREARAIAEARYDANQNQLNLLTNLLAAERQERVAGDINLSNTVSDTQTGSQQGTLTAQQAAELSAINSATNNLFTQAIMGNLSENPQKIQIYSAPQPCSCPNSCGCNCNVCPRTENIYCTICVPCSSNVVPKLGIGESTAAPTNVQACCNVTNAVAITTSLNVATA